MYFLLPPIINATLSFILQILSIRGERFGESKTMFIALHIPTIGLSLPLFS